MRERRPRQRDSAERTAQHKGVTEDRAREETTVHQRLQTELLASRSITGFGLVGSASGALVLSTFGRPFVVGEDGRADPTLAGVASGDTRALAIGSASGRAADALGSVAGGGATAATGDGGLGSGSGAASGAAVALGVCEARDADKSVRSSARGRNKNAPSAPTLMTTRLAISARITGRRRATAVAAVRPQLGSVSVEVPEPAASWFDSTGALNVPGKLDRLGE